MSTDDTYLLLWDFTADGRTWQEVDQVFPVSLDVLDDLRARGLDGKPAEGAHGATLNWLRARGVQPGQSPYAVLRATVFDADGNVADGTAFPVLDDDGLGYVVEVGVLDDMLGGEVVTRWPSRAGYRPIGRYPATDAVLFAFEAGVLVPGRHEYARAALLDRGVELELTAEVLNLSNRRECVTVARALCAARIADPGPVPADVEGARP